MLKPITTSLLSGLKVLRVPMQSESITCMLLVGVGSRYESVEKEGIAHFIEHLVFKGTKKFSSAKKLATVIDSVGASFNAFTSKEYTGFFVKSAAKHHLLALDVISDLIFCPNLLQKDINNERGVIIEELNMDKDTPSQYVNDLFYQMFFANRGLAHRILGNKKSINSLSQSDFRNFLSNWYVPSNMTLVLSGKREVINSAGILKAVKKFFSKKYDGLSKKGPEKASYLVKNPVSANNVKVAHKETEQAHFVLGWPGLNRSSKDKYALSLLSTILGGNSSSRLFSELREKRGLCYYVYSNTEHFADSGVFSLSAGVDVNRTEEAIKLALSESIKLASGIKKISKSELQRAKDFLIGRMTLGFEDSESVAQFYGLRQLLIGKTETFAEVVKKINEVTLEQIRELAGKIIKKQRPKLALIGPFKEKEKIVNWISV